MASLQHHFYTWRVLNYVLTALLLVPLSTAKPQLGINILPDIPSPLTCTDAAGYTYTNGSTYTSASRQFQILCGIDLLNLELTAFLTPYLSTCVDICVGNPYCVTATYDKATQRCSLKGQQGILAVVNGLVTAVVRTFIPLSMIIGLLPLNVAPVIQPPALATPSSTIGATSLPSGHSSSLASSTPLAQASSSPILPIFQAPSTVTIPKSSTGSQPEAEVVGDNTLLGVNLDLGIANIDIGLQGGALPSNSQITVPDVKYMGVSTQTPSVAQGSSPNFLDVYMDLGLSTLSTQNPILDANLDLGLIPTATSTEAEAGDANPLIGATVNLNLLPGATFSEQAESSTTPLLTNTTEAVENLLDILGNVGLHITPPASLFIPITPTPNVTLDITADLPGLPTSQSVNQSQMSYTYDIEVLLDYLCHDLGICLPIDTLVTLGIIPPLVVPSSAIFPQHVPEAVTEPGEAEPSQVGGDENPLVHVSVDLGIVLPSPDHISLIEEVLTPGGSDSSQSSAFASPENIELELPTLDTNSVLGGSFPTGEGTSSPLASDTTTHTPLVDMNSLTEGLLANTAAQLDQTATSKSNEVPLVGIGSILDALPPAWLGHPSQLATSVASNPSLVNVNDDLNSSRPSLDVGSLFEGLLPIPIMVQGPSTTDSVEASSFLSLELPTVDVGSFLGGMIPPVTVLPTPLRANENSESPRVETSPGLDIGLSSLDIRSLASKLLQMGGASTQQKTASAQTSDEPLVQSSISFEVGLPSLNINSSLESLFPSEAVSVIQPTSIDTNKAPSLIATDGLSLEALEQLLLTIAQKTSTLPPTRSVSSPSNNGLPLGVPSTNLDSNPGSIVPIMEPSQPKTPETAPVKSSIDIELNLPSLHVDSLVGGLLPSETAQSASPVNESSLIELLSLKANSIVEGLSPSLTPNYSTTTSNPPTDLGTPYLNVASLTGAALLSKTPNEPLFEASASLALGLPSRAPDFLPANLSASERASSNLPTKSLFVELPTINVDSVIEGLQPTGVETPTSSPTKRPVILSIADLGADFGSVIGEPLDTPESILPATSRNSLVDASLDIGIDLSIPPVSLDIVLPTMNVGSILETVASIGEETLPTPVTSGKPTSASSAFGGPLPSNIEVPIQATKAISDASIDAGLDLKIPSISLNLGVPTIATGSLLADVLPSETNIPILITQPLVEVGVDVGPSVGLPSIGLDLSLPSLDLLPIVENNSPLGMDNPIQTSGAIFRESTDVRVDLNSPSIALDLSAPLDISQSMEITLPSKGDLPTKITNTLIKTSIDARLSLAMPSVKPLSDFIWPSTTTNLTPIKPNSLDSLAGSLVKGSLRLSISINHLFTATAPEPTSSPRSIIANKVTALALRPSLGINFRSPKVSSPTLLIGQDLHLDFGSARVTPSPASVVEWDEILGPTLSGTPLVQASFGIEIGLGSFMSSSSTPSGSLVASSIASAAPFSTPPPPPFIDVNGIIDSIVSGTPMIEASVNIGLDLGGGTSIPSEGLPTTQDVISHIPSPIVASLPEGISPNNILGPLLNASPLLQATVDLSLNPGDIESSTSTQEIVGSISSAPPPSGLNGIWGPFLNPTVSTSLMGLPIVDTNEPLVDASVALSVGLPKLAQLAHSQMTNMQASPSRKLAIATPSIPGLPGSTSGTPILNPSLSFRLESDLTSSTRTGLADNVVMGMLSLSSRSVFDISNLFNIPLTANLPTAPSTARTAWPPFMVVDLDVGISLTPSAVSVSGDNPTDLLGFVNAVSSSGPTLVASTGALTVTDTTSISTTIGQPLFQASVGLNLGAQTSSALIDHVLGVLDVGNRATITSKPFRSPSVSPLLNIPLVSIPPVEPIPTFVTIILTSSLETTKSPIWVIDLGTALSNPFGGIPNAAWLSNTGPLTPGPNVAPIPQATIPTLTDIVSVLLAESSGTPSSPSLLSPPTSTPGLPLSVLNQDPLSNLALIFRSTEGAVTLANSVPGLGTESLTPTPSVSMGSPQLLGSDQNADAKYNAPVPDLSLDLLNLTDDVLDVSLSLNPLGILQPPPTPISLDASFSTLQIAPSATDPALELPTPSASQPLLDASVDLGFLQPSQSIVLDPGFGHNPGESNALSVSLDVIPISYDAILPQAPTTLVLGSITLPLPTTSLESKSIAPNLDSIDLLDIPGLKSFLNSLGVTSLPAMSNMEGSDLIVSASFSGPRLTPTLQNQPDLVRTSGLTPLFSGEPPTNSSLASNAGNLVPILPQATAPSPNIEAIAPIQNNLLDVNIAIHPTGTTVSSLGASTFIEIKLDFETILAPVLDGTSSRLTSLLPTGSVASPGSLSSGIDLWLEPTTFVQQTTFSGSKMAQNGRPLIKAKFGLSTLLNGVAVPSTLSTMTTKPYVDDNLNFGPLLSGAATSSTLITTTPRTLVDGGSGVEPLLGSAGSLPGFSIHLDTTSTASSQFGGSLSNLFQATERPFIDLASFLSSISDGHPVFGTQSVLTPSQTLSTGKPFIDTNFNLGPILPVQSSLVDHNISILLQPSATNKPQTDVSLNSDLLGGIHSLSPGPTNTVAVFVSAGGEVSSSNAISKPTNPLPLVGVNPSSDLLNIVTSTTISLPINLIEQSSSSILASSKGVDRPLDMNALLHSILGSTGALVPVVTPSISSETSALVAATLPPQIQNGKSILQTSLDLSALNGLDPLYSIARNTLQGSTTPSRVPSDTGRPLLDVSLGLPILDSPRPVPSATTGTEVLILGGPPLDVSLELSILSPLLGGTVPSITSISGTNIALVQPTPSLIIPAVSETLPSSPSGSSNSNITSSVSISISSNTPPKANPLLLDTSVRSPIPGNIASSSAPSTPTTQATLLKPSTNPLISSATILSEKPLNNVSLNISPTILGEQASATASTNVAGGASSFSSSTLTTWETSSSPSVTPFSPSGASSSREPQINLDLSHNLLISGGPEFSPSSTSSAVEVPISSSQIRTSISPNSTVNAPRVSILIDVKVSPRPLLEGTSQSLSTGSGVEERHSSLRSTIPSSSINLGLSPELGVSPSSTSSGLRSTPALASSVLSALSSPSAARKLAIQPLLNANMGLKAPSSPSSVGSRVTSASLAPSRLSSTSDVPWLTPQASISPQLIKTGFHLPIESAASPLETTYNPSNTPMLSTTIHATGFSPFLLSSNQRAGSMGPLPFIVTKGPGSSLSSTPSTFLTISSSITPSYCCLVGNGGAYDSSITQNSTRFAVTCDTMQSGGNIDSAQPIASSTSFTGCMDICSLSSLCVGVIWDSNTGDCSLKSQSSSDVARPGICSAKRVGQTGQHSNGVSRSTASSAVPGSLIISASRPLGVLSLISVQIPPLLSTSLALGASSAFSSSQRYVSSANNPERLSSTPNPIPSSSTGIQTSASPVLVPLPTSIPLSQAHGIINFPFTYGSSKPGAMTISMSQAQLILTLPSSLSAASPTLGPLRTLTQPQAAISSTTIALSRGMAPPEIRISMNRRCGANFGLTCKGSRFGQCCGSNGYW